jgi:uroporphyrin-III C-methyltransferase/precorrin-2 dehydrogenase/sirohydrochlorin ferrochelatase
MAASRLAALREAGARVIVVAPEILPEITAQPVTVRRKAFSPEDLDGVCLVVSAAPRGVNRAVYEAASARNLFVNSIDDPDTASAYSGGVIRRDGVLLALSTEGRAPALAGLLREGLDALLPRDLSRWMDTAEALRAAWKREKLSMEKRRPRLLEALVALYETRSPQAPQEDRNATP